MYPLFLTSGILWIWYLISGKITIWGFTNRIFLVRYWISDDSQVWFASLILIFYLLYPYIYYFLFEKKSEVAVQEHYVFKILFVLIGSFIWAEIASKLVSYIKGKIKHKSLA